MHVTFRLLTPADLEGCFQMLPSGFLCEASLRTHIMPIWREWLQQKSMCAVVLVAARQPQELRLVGFGISVFVTDAFAEELCSGCLPPSPASHVIARHVAGHSPVLNVKAIAQANSESGLNLLVLHIGWDERTLTSEETRWVKAKLLEAFTQIHSGYQIQEIMQEVYSPEEMRRGLTAGTLLRTDYGWFYQTCQSPRPSPAQYPFLLGVRREEVQDGCTVAPLFFYTAPRIFLKSWEQELLLHALEGKSDEALSADLYISPSTVQKRWHKIYERAAASIPELFPSGAAFGPPPLTRGGEKRRHLLAYLRQHPEELRPLLSPTAHRT